MDNYVAKNRGYITSHKLKLFLEDQWTYKLKYVDEVVPPYFERNPDKEKENEAFVIGQAVDDYLTFGKNWYDGHYTTVSQRVKDVSTKIKDVQEKMEGTTNKTTKTYEGLEEKLQSLRSLEGKIQLTETMQYVVDECVYESGMQPQCLPRYKKSVIIRELPGFNLTLKAELDHRSEDYKDIVDLKTCANIDDFNPSRYTWQMAFYHFLNEEETGEKATVRLHVLEKATPNRPFSRSKVIEYSQASLLDARRDIIEALISLKKVIESGEYEMPDLEQQLQSEYYGYEGYGRQVEPIYY